METRMKVHELIEKLQAFDPESCVYVDVPPDKYAGLLTYLIEDVAQIDTVVLPSDEWIAEYGTPHSVLHPPVTITTKVL